MMWQVFVPCAVKSLNEESGKNWQWRHRLRKQIRKDAWACAIQAINRGELRRFAHEEPVQIIVQSHERGRCLDPGNAMASAKAAIDGLRDARVLVDDSGRYVKAITFLAGVPVADERSEGLTIMFTEWTDGD